MLQGQGKQVMRVLRSSYVFMLLTLLCLSITSCADTQSTKPTIATTRNQLTTLALFSQAGFFTDSTPYLVVYPSPLTENNCKMSNHQAWTCVVTLYGQNIVNIVGWSAYTSNSSISINPIKGYLAQHQVIVQVTISNIPCMNTSFLFSGQTYGSGVIPATVTWNCIPKPIPMPTHQPIPTPSPQPSPTPIITASTSTPVATTIPRPTLTMTLPPTSVISSNSHSDPPAKGNDSTSGNIFLVSASIFLGVESIVALVLIAMLIWRKIAKT